MLPSQIDKLRANLLVTTTTGTASSSSTPSSSSTNKHEKSHTSSNVTLFAGGGYMICSALMLFINKLAIHSSQTPALVLFCQLFFCYLFVWIFGRSWKRIQIIEKVEPYQWSKIRSFLPAVVAFLGTIYFNIKTLQYCHVETFIVFRASTPILVSIGDWIFLGRELPSIRSFLCLIGLVVGVAIYTYTDHGFDIWGYRWLAAWYSMFIFDQLYIKFLCDRTAMTNFGRVYYLNGLSALPLLFLVVFQQELATFVWNTSTITPLFISCLLGIAMSYFAFYARALLSATSFTLLGNVCKILTVIINFLWWDKHANVSGVCALVLCLICAYFYKQADMRKDGTNRQSMIHVFKV